MKATETKLTFVKYVDVNGKYFLAKKDYI